MTTIHPAKVALRTHTIFSGAGFKVKCAFRSSLVKLDEAGAVLLADLEALNDLAVGDQVSIKLTEPGYWLTSRGNSEGWVYVPSPDELQRGPICVAGFVRLTGRITRYGDIQDTFCLLAACIQQGRYFMLTDGHRAMCAFWPGSLEKVARPVAEGEVS